MTFKDTINGIVKPKVNEDSVYNTGMLVSEDTTRKTDRAAMSKSRSRIENVQYNDLNIEIDQKDIDRAAKKYHKEMRSRRKEQNRERETSQLQHGFLPVSAEVLITENKEERPETQQEIRPRSRLRSHLRQQKHRRSQMANMERGRRQKPQETENLGTQEPTVRRLKQKKQHLAKIDHLDYPGAVSSVFRTQEELTSEAAHKHFGNSKQLRLNNDERGQGTDEELIHRNQRRQKKHSIRQHTLLETLEVPSKPEETSPRQRRQKHPRQRQQDPSEPTQDATSRQRHQHNHEQVRDSQGEESWILETVPVPELVPVPHSRNNRLRHPQANRVQSDRVQSNGAHLLGDSPETSSRQRRHQHLAQQHAPPESPIQLRTTDSESRLRHILHQQLPPNHQVSHPELFQRRLRSPINDVATELPESSQRRPRVQNSSRILHPCDRISFSEDDIPQSSSQEDLPPFDEYYAGNEAEIPPYHATLHKYLDLISYDPRVVPCLRVNRALIKSNDKLSESIFQFLKFNLFPESIDPWEISHIDDQYYDDLIPELIPVETDSSDVLPNIPYEPHYRHHNDVMPRIISDDDYEYALYLSSLENNVHTHTMNISSTIGS